MSITLVGLVRAKRILRSWRSRAKAKGNKQGLEDVELIMKVMSELYTG